MKDKKGDFEGEYDFYDEDDEDEEYSESYDFEGDREDELDEDILKEKEQEKFLSRRRQELTDTMQGFISNKGYVETYPNIHFSDVIDGEYKTLLSKEEEKFEVLTEDTLDSWLTGELKFDKTQEELLKKWYPSGTYRFYKILSKLKRKHDKEEEESKLSELEELIELNQEKFDNAKKKELGEAYNESGKRLNELYMAIYGRTDKKCFDMGCFRIGIPVMFYEEKMKESGYKKSKSFFEDFKKARDFIFSLKGDLVVGALTDKCHEDIGGYAQGEVIMESGSRKFEIMSTIIREEWFEEKNCYSLVSSINISNDDFMFWLNKHHPEIDVAITNEDSVVFWQGKELDGEYWPQSEDNFHLSIGGALETQEKFIKSIIDYIAEEKL